MPISIRDRQLSDVYSKLQKANQGIDDSNVLQVLASVADTSKSDASEMLTKLSAPGLTRQQQIDLVTAGMSATEKKDLGNLLDHGDLKISDSAKAFLESVLGRTPTPTPKPSADPLQITLTKDQKSGIAGAAGAGVTIEAINLSTAPEKRLHDDDTFVIGNTDAKGNFVGKMPDMQDGDVIRMRARDASGKVGDWITVKADTGAKDTRNAEVALFRIGLADAGNGKIDVTNINDVRQISEPGAKLQFTNARTGEKTLVAIDDQGQMPKGLKLNGKPGDSFAVAATDGVNNTDFKTVAGPALTVPGGGTGPGGLVDLPDPALHKDELDANGKPKFTTERFTGPLFKDGVSYTDPVQGQLGDCYFPSACASLAKTHPEVIQNMIKDNGDGTYTVTWKKQDYKTGKYVDVPIRVDGDLYARAWGGPLYGSSSGDTSTKGMELWFPLLEKSWAVWKGSYNDVGSGGQSNDVFEAAMGIAGKSESVSYTGSDQLWSEIKDAVDHKRPTSAGTYGEEESAKYTNTGVYADHSYTILGYKEKDGVKYVTLRNPWGESEPPGDGKDDGIFDLKYDDFRKLYESFMTAGS